MSSSFNVSREHGDPNRFHYNDQGYGMNSKIIVAAIVVLFMVVLFILLLHLYAKWFWRRSRRRQALWRMPQGLDSQGQELIRVPESIGLEISLIESLPTFVYKLAQLEKDVLDCAVCLCEFQENERGRLLPKCNHSFHTECIDMWFHSHSTCPICRAPAIVSSEGKEQDASAETSSTFLLTQNAGEALEGRQGGSSSQTDDRGEASTDSREGSQDIEDASSRPEECLLSRRTTSDRFPQSQGVQYPTNVLFWGNHSHVSARMSSPRLEHGQRGGRSLPHIVIDIPRRTDNFSLTPRCASMTPSRCSSSGDLSCFSPNGQQPLKSPVARLKTFKRLLSRERKVFPTEQDGGDCEQSGCTVSST